MGAAAHRKFLNLSIGGILCMILFVILKSAFTSDFRHIASKIMDNIRPDTAGLPPLRELTLEKASEGLRLRSFTSSDLTKAQIARTDKVSAFNAVLQINPDALAVAGQGVEDNRPLRGIPIFVKDNIATDDPKLDVSVGSYAHLGAKPRNESSVISKLRAAGAVILGKGQPLGMSQR